MTRGRTVVVVVLLLCYTLFSPAKLTAAFYQYPCPLIFPHPDNTYGVKLAKAMTCRPTSKHT